jgi:hypothetical protein
MSHPRSVALRLLALSSLAVLVAAASGALGLWWAGRSWPVLVPAAALALVGALDLAWARHARAAHRLAVLDAYAEREIARSRHRQGRERHG